MTKYNVTIRRTAKPELFARYYTSVKPIGQQSWYKIRYSLTLWGARRNAKLIVKQLEKKPRETRVEDYEI